MKIRVYYEDTDVGGVVYHSNYLNFCERARSEAFFHKGMTPILKNGHFVVRKLEALFLKSAHLGDTLEVCSTLKEIKSASFTLQQDIYKGEQKVFSLTISLAFLNFEGKVQKIDTSTKELICSLFQPLT